MRVEHYAESAILGILQGVFEWLPVSSTGELVIIMTEVFDHASQDATDLSFFLHLGTVGSATLYLRRDIFRIFKNMRRYHFRYDSPDNSIISFLIVSTLLSGALGFVVFSYASDAAISGEFLLGMVGVALIATGIILYVSKQSGTKTADSITLQDTILLGVVQAFSVIPGLSRSGITVSAFLLRGYSAPEALRLSFLMGIPAVLVAQAGLLVVYGLPDMPSDHLLVGLLSAFAAGYLSIHILVRVASRISFWWFAIMMGLIALSSFAGLL